MTSGIRIGESGPWTRTLVVVAALGLVVLAYCRVPLSVFLSGFLLVTVSAWFLDTRTNIFMYLILLGIQMPQDTYHFRFALADCFLLPVIGALALQVWRERRWAGSEFTKPFVLLAIAFCIATAVAVFKTHGHPGTWALVNKDIGLGFLLAGFYALIAGLPTRAEVLSGVRAFVLGVSVSNALALVLGVGGVVLGFWPENIIFSTSGRLNGWMLNPTSNGSLLMTALLLDLATPNLTTRRRQWLADANLLLLVVGLMLTLSRSIWMANGAAAGGLCLLWILRWKRRPRVAQLAQVVMAAVVAAISLGPIGWIAVAQRVRVAAVAQRGDGEQAAELRARLVGTCAAKWDDLLCKDIPIAEIEAVRAESTTVARAPAVTHPKPATAAPMVNPDGALMNARGLEDRASILRLAWQKYRASAMSKALGIGLGTFYATSAPVFGVPVIIHSSPAWFLVELGPIGMIAFVWILWIAARSAFYAQGALEPLGLGVLAALAGWFVLSVLNEAFYFRHFWLLLVLAERLWALRQEPVAQ